MIDQMGSHRASRWAVRRLAALAVGLALGLASAAQAAYQITTLDYAGADSSQGWDINNNGVFVGTATFGADVLGYLVSGGVSTSVTGPAGSLGSSALGISDGGAVVGSFYSTRVNVVDPGPQTGYILDSGVYTTLSLPGSAETYLRAISPGGRYVTGYAITGAGQIQSFVYDRNNSTFTILTTSNQLTIAQGVTDAGVVVGNLRSGAQRDGFIYDAGVLSFSHQLGALDTDYRGINESGLIDGFYVDATGTTHGLLGAPGSFVTFDVAGAAGTNLEGINNAGWLAGIYGDANGVSHAFLATPVPAPPVTALLLLALPLLGARRRH